MDGAGVSRRRAPLGGALLSEPRSVTARSYDTASPHLLETAQVIDWNQLPAPTAEQAQLEPSIGRR